MLKKIIIPILFAFFANASSVDTNELMVLDLDQLNKIINRYIQTSQDIAIKSQYDGNEEEKEGDVIFELKKALLIVMARPNRDFMSVKLLPDIDRHLKRYGAYYKTMSSLAKEAQRTLADKESPIKIQSSYLYVIENILAELKPELKENKEAQEIYKFIADNKIKVSNKLASFRRMEKMESNDFSPSKYARKQLDKALGKKKPWWKFW